MAQLAIKGHATRGKEVIELLEMLGGRNDCNYGGGVTRYIYTIDEKGTINWYIPYPAGSFVVFTLEEFLEKFPHKVGDKVSSKYLKNYKIAKIEWEGTNNRVIYKLQGMGWYSVDELQPYKEETMEEQNEKSVNHVYENEVISFDIAQKDKYELDLRGKFEVKLRDGKYFVERIKPQYPKTYKECCKELGHPQTLLVDRILGYKGTLLNVFQQLLICRDAYWKIAGEQMGLGKPWEPRWNDSYQRKWIINFYQNEIDFTNVLNVHHILAFPTAEMRYAFFENFRELINETRELL